MDVTIFMAFQPGELPNVNYHTQYKDTTKFPKIHPLATAITVIRDSWG